MTTFRGHRDKVRAVAWSPSGDHLASSDVGEIKVWDARTDPEHMVLRGRDAVKTRDVAWSPDGALIAVTAQSDARTGQSTNLWVWESATGRLARDLSEATYNTETTSLFTSMSVSWSPDGRILAWSDPHDCSSVRTAEVATGRLIHKLLASSVSPIGVIDGVAAQMAVWSSDGSRLISSDFTGVNVVWDPATGRGLNAFRGGLAVAWNPDGTRLAVAEKTGGITLRDAATGRVLLPLGVHGGVVVSLAHDSDGHRLASAGWDGVVRVWDLTGGREPLTLAGYSKRVFRVAGHPEGKRLASAGEDGTVRIWNAETGQEILSLRGHGQSVSSVAWSPDGRKLATVGDDGTVKIRDASAGYTATITPPLLAGAFDRRRAAYARLDLARFLMESGRKREAAESLRLALDGHDALTHDFPTWIEPQASVANGLPLFARTALSRGHRELSDRAFLRSLDIRRRHLPREVFRNGARFVPAKWEPGRPGGSHLARKDDMKTRKRPSTRQTACRTDSTPKSPA